MMPTRLPVASALALIAAASASAQQLPPVRQLGTTVAKSSESFATIIAARQLPGGRVLVNDPIGRRVVMFDSALTSVTIVADSTPTTSNAYSSRAGGLLGYRGDSALFVDAASVSMSVIDPSGKISRVISVPRSQDAMFLTGMTGGLPGFDAEGRLVYRGMLRPTFNFSTSGGGMPVPPPQPDSAPLIRVDLVSRKVDTVAYMKIPKMNMTVTGTPETGIRMTSEINPMPVVDDYAVTSDGAIALLRGRDYHIDWLQPDGSLSPASKIPFEWQRLTDEGKVAVIDSAKAAMEAARASGQLNASAERQAGMVAGMAAAAGGGGERRMVIMGGPPGAGDGRGGAPGGMNVTPNFVSPTELPDYRPAFGAGAARPDAEGNIWVRTSKSINGGPVYDVINKKGEVTDRVVIPAGRQIVGFGKDGSVYLVAREGQTAKLERARVK
jgi:hypothetical protein